MAKDTTEYDRAIMARIHELKEENTRLHLDNARLRQQRDAANAQLDFILNNLEAKWGTNE